MANQPYLPREDEGKEKFLNNLATKIESYALLLNLSAAEITAVRQAAALWTYLLGIMKQNKKDMKELTAYKNILRDGPFGTDTSNFPSFTTSTVPLPPLVPADIFGRVAKLILKIKGHEKYNDAIGQDLGIIGVAAPPVDTVNMKPALKLVLNAGKVDVKWKKGNATAIRIEVKRVVTATAFTFLTIDTEPDYTDTTPFPAAPAVWIYRAIYMIGDEIVGQMSDEVKITVG